MKFRSQCLTLLLASICSGLPLNAHYAPSKTLPNAALWSSSTAVPYRILTNKDPNGFTLELDDGAVWRVVDASDASAVKDWRANDLVVIFPSLFPKWSGARFYVWNERTNTTAFAELALAPIMNTPTHIKIIDIDYYRGLLFVVDGAGRASSWKVSSSDLEIIRSWKWNHTLILGLNEGSYSGWFSSSSYILINVDRNDFVTASLQ